MSHHLNDLPLYTPTLLVETSCLLGEGPIWDSLNQKLYWVDIKRSTLWSWSWPTDQAPMGQVSSWKLDVRGSALALFYPQNPEDSLKEGLLIAAEQGLYHFHIQTQVLTHLLTLPNETQSNRTNDGKCDPFGHFWVGTMDDQEQNDTGNMYRIDENLNVYPYQDHIGVSNTFAWHPSTHRFYFADSKKQTIFKYKYTESTHHLSSPQPWVQIEDAYPDGSCIDSQGNLWNCQWDGSRVNQYSPQGTLLRSCDLDVPRPTSCTLGGPHLNLLFITSASVGLNDEDLNKAPLSGSVWVMRVEEKGTEEHRFILNRK